MLVRKEKERERNYRFTKNGSHYPPYLCDGFFFTFAVNRLSYDSQCQDLNLFVCIEK